MQRPPHASQDSAACTAGAIAVSLGKGPMSMPKCSDKLLAGGHLGWHDDLPRRMRRQCDEQHWKSQPFPCSEGSAITRREF